MSRCHSGTSPIAMSNSTRGAIAMNFKHTKIMQVPKFEIGFFSLSMAILLLLLLPRPSFAQQLQSFQSLNYQDHYIRHRNFLGYLDPVAVSDKLARQDATFQVVPGLAGKCESFESVNHQDFFLRHQDFRVKLAKREDTPLFKEDATFCRVPGLANQQLASFESANFPGQYIRHFNFELWLNKPDGTEIFKKDATFLIIGPLTVGFPSSY
jgi:hypothetical protein